MSDSHRRWVRRLGPTLVIVLLAAGGVAGALGLWWQDHHTGQGGDPLRTSPVPSPTVACPESGFVVVPGLGEAAMGLRVLTIELVNCGTAPYTVNGYPTIRILDEQRKPVEVTVGRGSSGISTIDSFEVPPKSVTLQPGQKAVAGLVWRNTVTDTSVPANGRFVEVAPAADVPPQVVEPDGPIDVGTTGRLGVSPWRAAN